MQDPTTLFPVPTPTGKKVFAAFDTGELTTDSGITFIRSVDEQIGLTASLAPLLPDPRNPLLVHHQHLDLLRQRVYSIVAGYEDTNDATKLRSDPAFKLAAGRMPFDSRTDLASQPSLCRFEHRITAQALALMQMTYFENWLAHRERPRKLVLDMDSTWDETHGAQQLTFFNGHYDSYGYHPLLVFDAKTSDLIVAHLRPGNAGAAEGALALLQGLVEGIRAKWPGQPILFRADGGFATPEIYEWCEANAVEYVIGLPINKALERLSADCLTVATAKFVAGRRTPGGIGKAFTEFQYKAESWKKARRVIAKAEYGGLGPNQRYVVTNLPGGKPRRLYEFYCERGQSENMIKNLKNALLADRLSCSDFLANAFRLLLHAVAYRLCLALARVVEKLTGESWQFDTIRLRLIKVAGRFVEQSRRILLHLPAAFPFAKLWARVSVNLNTQPQAP